MTVGLWEIDEPLMARCAELRVDRFTVIAPTQTPAALRCFLDQYLEAAGRAIR